MLCKADYDFAAHIHMFHWSDLDICLDVNSGAIHLLDQVSWRLMELLALHQGDEAAAFSHCCKEFPVAEVAEALSEIKEAVCHDALLSEPQPFDFDYAALSIKALCLNIAHACNMKCRYCFAHQGDFGGQTALMSSEVGRCAIDLLLKESTARQVEVDFFGGEPLLNGSLIRELVDYGYKRALHWGKNIHFTLTTNALLLDEAMMDFIIDKQISVVLSMDGEPSTHNFNRPLKNGEGSYDKVLPRIQSMVQRNPVSYYIRGTFTRDTMNFTSDFRHLADLGFESISLEPAVGPGMDFAIREEDLPAVASEYETLVDTLLAYHQAGKTVSFFHFNLDLQRGPCLAKRMTGCGAGVEYLAVTPEGDLYPCHQLVGQDKFYMGSVLTGEINADLKQRFARSHLGFKSECQGCWIRYFCGGGCHANNYLGSGSLEQPHRLTCAMHRKRIEAAIYLNVKKRLPEMDLSKTKKQEIQYYE